MTQKGNVVLWVVLAVLGAILAVGGGIGVKYVLTPKQNIQEQPAVSNPQGQVSTSIPAPTPSSTSSAVQHIKEVSQEKSRACIAPASGKLEQTTIVDQSGGTAKSSDGKLVLEIPSGALKEKTSINLIIRNDIWSYGELECFYEIQPYNISFLKEAKLSLSYEPSHLPALANEVATKILKLGLFDSLDPVGTNTTTDTILHRVTIELEKQEVFDPGQISGNGFLVAIYAPYPSAQ